MPVSLKFAFVLTIASIWAVMSYLIARRWISDLSALIGAPLAVLIIWGVAILPGFMNAFLVSGLLMDRRPRRRSVSHYPGISILVAAFNEEDSILSTLESIALQKYAGQIEVIVINDGSTDGTMEKLASISYPWLNVIDLPHNGGKANALNEGLKRVTFALTITLDADSCLYTNALTNLVGRFLSDPVITGAVAGAVLVRNSRLNLVTKIQEWDYFHGIAAVKRLQSLFQGTLVA
jgi:biofilm PGA synthesis N-glycosyltransferase PgaC